MAGVEELVKKIRPAYFVSVNATKDSGFYELQQEMNKYVGLDLFINEPELGAGGGGSILPAGATEIDDR